MCAQHGFWVVYFYDLWSQDSVFGSLNSLTLVSKVYNEAELE